jgi:uncharacterized membrane protein
VTDVAQQGPQSGSKALDRLKSEASGLVGALGDRALSSVLKRVEGTSGRLSQYVEGGAGPGLMAAVTGARGLAEGKSPGRSMLGAGMSFVKEKIGGLFRRRGKAGGRKLKLTNIVESIDVGVPVKVAYNQWTQYSDFPKFTKKVENADHNKNEPAKVNWKAQVFWSHRTWEATVMEQVPDDRIIWRSKGQKGHVDGAATFHELAPNLTRILLVLEYHPQGLFERTGNLWRAQGRRARLELKHFRRHMMTEGILHADDLEGWRGTIHDGEVVESHEDATAREEQDESRQAADGQAGERTQERGERAEERGERAEDRGERAEERAEDRGDQAGDRRRERAQDRGDREQEPEQEEDQENGDRRAAEGEQRPSRARRTAPVSRTNRSGERRSRAGAATQRGGNR